MKTQAILRRVLFCGIAASLTLPALPVKAAAASALPQAAADKKVMHDKLQEAAYELNLNDDQKAKLKDVFSDAKSKRDAIMNDTSLNADQRKEKMKSLHHDTMSKVNEVLTPDQRTQLKDKLQAERPSNY
jgi:Spy/CpxP family protein refolding chaperone